MALETIPVRNFPTPGDALVQESDPEDSYEGSMTFFEIVWWAIYEDRATGAVYRVRQADHP